MGIRKLPGVLTMVLVVGVGRCPADRSSSALEDFDRKVVALLKVVNYMVQRPEQMNVDAVFGITLTGVHASAALRHANHRRLRPDHLSILNLIVELCENARRYMTSVVKLENEQNAILNRVMNQPRIWIRPIVWKRGALGPLPPPRPGLTAEEALRMIYQGTPQEAESDRCLAELARDGSAGFCRVSDACARMLLRKDNSRGYPLAHRMLYVRTAVALGCREYPSAPFREMVPSFCTAILQDLIDIEATGFPAMSRDLAMEQVLLCGMEGYLDFANDHYADLVLSWPNSAGCFSAYGFGNAGGRAKRESAATDFGCDNHATALGAASLALLIRQSVETVTDE